jgi:hypothetical protein
MNIPILDKNKCSVLIAENATGHVFKSNLTIFKQGENEKEVFQIFENLNQAKDYITNFINKNPKFECTIFNNKGEFVSLINLKGEWENSTNG